METDIESKIIPKDTILSRMCNDKMPGAIEEINGVILRASSKGRREAAIAYNVLSFEVRQTIPVLEDLLKNAGYYIRIDPDYSVMETRLIIRW